MIQIQPHHETVCNFWKPRRRIAEQVLYIFTWIIMSNHLIDGVFSNRDQATLCVTKLIRMFICPIGCCSRWQNGVVVLASREIVVSVCKLCQLFLHERDPKVEKKEAVEGAEMLELITLLMKCSVRIVNSLLIQFIVRVVVAFFHGLE